MAKFGPAFDEMIRNEGGYRLTNVAGDRGGQTYAGIARNFHPGWPGWRYIDDEDLDPRELPRLVRKFYRDQFWSPIGGDKIRRQAIAQAIFDFSVNAGVAVGSRLAQRVVGAAADGRIGPKTLALLNKMNEAEFVLKYALEKVTRYAEICNQDRTQTRFLLGWINRTLKGLA